MAEVSGNTLVMAIQAVDQQLHALGAQIDAMDPHDRAMADLEDMQLAYAKAATELRQAYSAAWSDASNLPPYASLVQE